VSYSLYLLETKWGATFKLKYDHLWPNNSALNVLVHSSQDHVSLDAVHLPLELVSFGIHARNDVANIADNRGEDQDGDENLTHNDAIFGDSCRMRHVAHHCQRQRWPIERVRVDRQQTLRVRVSSIRTEIHLGIECYIQRITWAYTPNIWVMLHAKDNGSIVGLRCVHVHRDKK